MSKKCGNIDCFHKSSTEHDLCSLCRVARKPRVKCEFDGCENITKTGRCHHHALKLNECSHIKHDGSICKRGCRGTKCCRHTPAGIANRKKNKNAYRKYDPSKYDPTKMAIKNREKRIQVLQSQIDKLRDPPLTSPSQPVECIRSF